MDNIFILKDISTESENHMSKYLAFIAALPLAVMPLPLAFMILNAAQESTAVGEQGQPSAIVSQEITAKDVPRSNAALKGIRENARAKFNKPKRVCGRRDVDCRQRNQRKRKQIVVPSGINDAFAVNVNQIRISWQLVEKASIYHRYDNHQSRRRCFKPANHLQSG